MALSGLALWLSDRYSTIGSQLNFTETVYNILVDDTLELMGIESENEVDAIDLHKVATYVLWRQALAEVTLDTDFSADGSSFRRSAMYDQIKQNLLMAERDASDWLADADITIETVSSNDPYNYNEDRDNAGF